MTETEFAFFYLKAESVQCDGFHFFRAVSFWSSLILIIIFAV